MDSPRWGPVVAFVVVAGIAWIVADGAAPDGSRLTANPPHLIALLLGVAAVVAACVGAFSPGGAWAVQAAGIMVLAAACMLAPQGWAAPVALGLAIGLPAFGSALRGRERDCKDLA